MPEAFGPSGARSAWQATPARSRALLVLAGALLAAAAVFSGAAANATPKHVLRVIRSSTPAAVTVDATGCPVSARCRVEESATASLVAAFTRRFPRATVLGRTQTSDLLTGLIYRSAIIALAADGSTLSVATQCDPSAPSAPAYQRRNVVSHTDLAGNQVVDTSTLTTVVPGRAGCSVAVQVRSHLLSGADSAAAAGLANDPQAQLGR